MNYFLISQIAAFFSVIFGLALPYLFDSRKFILSCKIIANFCWIIHHYLIGTPSAALNALIGLLVTLFCYHRVSLPFNKSKIYPTFFLILNGAITFFAYTSITSLFAYAGSSMAILGRWQFKTQAIRLMSLLSVIPWILFSITSNTPIGIAVNSFSIIMILIAIYRFDIIKQTKA